MRGNITRRGQDSWRIRIYVGRHPQTGVKRYVSRTVHGTRRTAEQAAAKLIVEVGAGFHTDDDHTIAELVTRWFELRQRNLAPATALDYRSVIDHHIIPYLGPEKVGRLRPSHLDQWYATLPLGPARVRRIHNVLASAFDQAIRWQWIVYNPVRNAFPPRIVETEIEPPTVDDVRRLLDHAAATDPDLAAYVLLAADSGARRGELLALRWSDVDLDNGSMVIRRALTASSNGITEKKPKNNTARALSLGANAVASLRAMRGRQRERALAVGVRLDDGPVFTSDEAARTNWYPSGMSRRFKALTVAAGVPGIRLHDLRHFVATQMLAAGADPRTVAGRLGHKRTSMMLDRYAHFVPAADRAAIDELDRRLRD